MKLTAYQLIVFKTKTCFCFHVHVPSYMYESSYINLTPKMQFQWYGLISHHFLLCNLQLIFMTLTLLTVRY